MQRETVGGKNVRKNEGDKQDLIEKEANKKRTQNENNRTRVTEAALKKSIREKE